MWKSLKDHRSAAGLTLAELSRQTGVSVSVLSRIERGHQKITLDMMTKIADALGKPLASLLDDEHQTQHQNYTVLELRAASTEGGRVLYEFATEAGSMSFLLTREQGAYLSVVTSRVVEKLSEADNVASG